MIEFVGILFLLSGIGMLYVWNKTIRKTVDEKAISRTDIQGAAIKIAIGAAIVGTFGGLLISIIVWETAEVSFHPLETIDNEALFYLGIIPFCTLCYPLIVGPFFLMRLFALRRRLSPDERQ
jgi:tetrahydromethanopterin S-methyltransferase subunit C